MRKILLSAAAILLISVLFLCGCSAESKNSPQNTAESTIYDFEPVTKIKDGQKNIYVVLKVMNSQYWQDIIDGTAAAGKDLGCNVYVGGPSGESDWEIQRDMLERAVNELGADAVLLAPGNSSSLVQETANIYEQGIPVILIDTIVNSESYNTCYMTDNLQAGELAAAEMLDKLISKGVPEDENLSIAIQITSTASQTIIDRLAGFNQYWAANAPENWKVLDEVKLNNGDKEKAKQNCLDFIAQYPDLKGVFGCNNSSTVGFVNGLTENGRNDIVLVGFDYADETAALVASDNFSASTIVQNQYNMGYDGVKEALDVLNGKKSEYKFIDTGTVVINHGNYREYEAEGDKK